MSSNSKILQLPLLLEPNYLNENLLYSNENFITLTMTFIIHYVWKILIYLRLPLSHNQPVWLNNILISLYQLLSCFNIFGKTTTGGRVGKSLQVWYPPHGLELNLNSSVVVRGRKRNIILDKRRISIHSFNILI